MRAPGTGWLASALLGAALASSTPAFAQDYPAREIKLVCAFVAGSGADVIHRYFAKQLQPIVGKPVLVENKPGASGNLAHAYVAKAKPDGYTVYPVGGTALAASVHLFKKPPVDPLADFESVGTLLKQGWYIVVDAKSPIKTLPELTALLKQKGDKGSYGTATVTGTVVGELYKTVAGLQTVQINYKTAGDATNDLLSGNIDFLSADAAFALGQVRAGRMRMIAVSTAQRARSVPDVPTMAEGGVPGVDVMVWWGVQVPAGTPKPIIEKLRVWFDQVLKMPETEQFLASIGTDVFISTPDETRALIKKEIDNWGRMIKAAKIDPT